MHRHFVPTETLKDERIALDHANSRHFLNVLRLKRGDEVEPGIYESDFPDTYLGNKAAWDTADDSTIGFAIIVEGETPVPTPPTGEGSMIWWGVGLVAVSGTILLVELIVNRRRKKAEAE